MMSHEIRTPLNIIMGMLQILLEEEPRPDQTDALEKGLLLNQISSWDNSGHT